MDNESCNKWAPNLACPQSKCIFHTIISVCVALHFVLSTQNPAGLQTSVNNGISALITQLYRNLIFFYQWWSTIDRNAKWVDEFTWLLSNENASTWTKSLNRMSHH